MSRYIMDPKAVDQFLTKPYDLREAWQKVSKGKSARFEESITYTSAEISLIHQEVDRLYKNLTAGRQKMSQGRKQFTLSAGGPGAGKSKLLERMFKTDSELQNAVFSDPHEYGLKLMKPFRLDVYRFGGGSMARAISYTKWKSAANFISNSIMNRAFRDGYDILFSTTATGPVIGNIYDNIRNEGYDSRTIIVAAPKRVRQESLQRRFKENGMRNMALTDEKNKYFYDHLPVYFKKSDSLSLYWRREVDNNPALVAEGENGEIVVHRPELLEEVERNIRTIKPEISWRGLNSIYKQRF